MTKRDTFYKFLENKNNLAVVSPRRSGIHFLATAVSKYFGKEILFFDGKENIHPINILMVHTHDDNRTFKHSNVIYLYRKDIKLSIFSKMFHEEADMDDIKRIKRNIELYALHIKHWLKRADVVLTYESLIKTIKGISKKDVAKKYPYVMKQLNYKDYYNDMFNWALKYSWLFDDII